jgi:hypothetical protein
MKQPWDNPSDAPVIEQSIHDYIVSIFRAQRGRRLEIVPISPGAEASRGWDAAVVEAVPLFFQYKLPDFTSRPAKSQPQAAEIRKSFGFNDDNGLFHFRLRKKAASEPRSQHELMLALEADGYPVYYVSTDFIDQSRLRFGGDLHACGRPWISKNHSIGHEIDGIYEYIAPWFDGLICIPPFTEVSAPVENHKFLYNQSLEVSLHSDPTHARAVPLIQVIADQAFLLGADASINEKNADKHISAILHAIAGGVKSEKTLSLVQDYYVSLHSGSEKYRTSLMGRLRPLAQVVKTLTGIDVFFTVRLNPPRPLR